jgi:lipoprotein signal peptidase
MTRIGVRVLLVLAIAATVSCDRATKHIAATTLAGVPSQSFLADTVRLHYVENTGGFLSLGADLPPAIRTGVFTVGTGLALFALVASAIVFRWTGWPLLGLTLFVAGGASNWVDRVAHGSHRLHQHRVGADPDGHLQRRRRRHHARCEHCRSRRATAWHFRPASSAGGERW